MDKYYISFIKSAYKYLVDLQYLAKNSDSNLNDLFDIEILLDLYEWCEFQESDENSKIFIEKLINSIIMNNPELSLPEYLDARLYTNVNIPQTIWTWQLSNSNWTVINSL